MIVTKNRTPVSPTAASSDGYVAYNELGPRPKCVECGDIEECPVCEADSPYKIPLVSGDLIYLQYSFEDVVNDDVAAPSAGWFSEDESDYYVKATIEFSNADVDTLVLDEADVHSIIRSQYVLYEGTSYQNLVLNSATILQYIQSFGVESTCFRLLLETYRVISPVDYTIYNFYNVLPSLPFPPSLTTGSFIIVGPNVYQFNGTGFDLHDSTENGQIIFNSLNGIYYEVDNENPKYYVQTVKPNDGVEIATQCYTSWYKFLEECVPSVVVEGVHGISDCAGYYYDNRPQLGQLVHRDRWRIEGSFEPTGITFDETENEDGKVTSFKEYENYLFRPFPALPWVIVQKLGNTISATKFYLNNNEYINISDITKGNEQGNYFLFNLTMQRLACEKENDCDEAVIVAPIIDCDVTTPLECLPATVNRDGIFYATVLSGATINVESDCPPCEDATVTNSDLSFNESVASGGNLPLDDYTVETYIDSVLFDSQTVPAMNDITVNINWI